jgi:NADH-quinone oxidoreductase subunit H
MLPILLEALIMIAVVVGGLMTAAAYLVLAERWIAAWIQDRQGPNRVGVPLTKIKLFGLGQPLADGVKFIFKAEYTPDSVDKGLYFLAPAVIFISALAVFAVIPFGSVLPNDLLPASWHLDNPVKLVIAPNIDVGMIFIFALGSVAVYGVVLGGWASNNKYSFLGGLRSSAQLIAYELPMGLGILGVVLCTGSLNLDKIMEHQAQTGAWNFFVQPLGMVVFCVAAFAEAGRLPFDLPECEQELIGGYHTEYFGIKLMMYLVGEYLHMVAAAFLIVILFFGGWHFWGLTASGDQVAASVGWFEAVLRIVILNVKVLGVIFFFMLARWSWARFRYDQLMSLAWLVMLPLGMVNLVYVAIWEEYGGNWAKSAGFSPALAMTACGWAVLIATWYVGASFSPSISDNIPRRGLLGANIMPSGEGEEVLGR